MGVDMEGVFQGAHAALKRLNIVCALLGIAAAMVFGYWLFADALERKIADMREMRIDELPMETGTLDGMRHGRTEEAAIAEIDGVEYKVDDAFADVSGLSSGEKVEFRVRDGLIVEVGEDLDGGL